MNEIERANRAQPMTPTEISSFLEDLEHVTDTKIPDWLPDGAKRVALLLQKAGDDLVQAQFKIRAAEDLGAAVDEAVRDGRMDARSKIADARLVFGDPKGRVALTVSKCWACPLREIDGDGRGNRWDVCFVTKNKRLTSEGVPSTCPLLKGTVNVELDKKAK